MTIRAKRIQAGEYEYRGFNITRIESHWNGKTEVRWNISQGGSDWNACDTLYDCKHMIDGWVEEATV
jgi:hypothetical protein